MPAIVALRRLNNVMAGAAAARAATAKGSNR
jgi:hypothetical protein